MKVLVPTALQKENEELKETIEILHTVIDIYKQTEIQLMKVDMQLRILNKQCILNTIVDIALQVTQIMV